MYRNESIDLLWDHLNGFYMVGILFNSSISRFSWKILQEEKIQIFLKSFGNISKHVMKDSK